MPSFIRLRMALELENFTHKAPVPPRYEIASLTEEDIERLVRLELVGYRGAEDSALRPELGSLEACRGFFFRMFSGGMGPFRPDLSFKLLRGLTLCGAIYTFTEGDLAYIADFVIAPSFRGRGLGEILLTYALHRYRNAGYHRAALAVTATNKAAVRLYKKLGFRVEKSFSAG